MEELAIFDAKFVYVKEEDNTVADALSHLPYKYIASTEEKEVQESAKCPWQYQHSEKIRVLDTHGENPKHVVAALARAAPKDTFKIKIEDA